MKTSKAENFLLEKPWAKEHKRRVKDIGIYQHYAPGLVLGIRLNRCFYLLNDLLNGTDTRQALTERMTTKVCGSLLRHHEIPKD